MSLVESAPRVRLTPFYTNSIMGYKMMREWMLSLRPSDHDSFTNISDKPAHIAGVSLLHSRISRGARCDVLELWAHPQDPTGHTISL